MGLITSVSDFSTNRLRAQIDRMAAELALPTHLLLILLAVEDKRFPVHRGIDAPAVIRAAWANLNAGKWVQGGSTITQQLIRLREPEPGWPTRRSIRVKLYQARRAIQIERVASKTTILSNYLTLAYFGRGHYGLGPASVGYFGLGPQDLRPAQSFFLVDRLAMPSKVAVSRLGNLLTRAPVRAALTDDNLEELVLIYETYFHCGDDIWRFLVRSPKKSAVPTLSY